MIRIVIGDWRHLTTFCESLMRPIYQAYVLRENIWCFHRQKKQPLSHPKFNSFLFDVKSPHLEPPRAELCRPRCHTSVCIAIPVILPICHGQWSNRLVIFFATSVHAGRTWLSHDYSFIVGVDKKNILWSNYFGKKKILSTKVYLTILSHFLEFSVLFGCSLPLFTALVLWPSA